ncbi:MAG: OmpH family outer membrane protein [Flavobacteriaceae bacterium]|nr:OmpH family outer membrane protein [Bacteroidia bacterium]NNK82258.1 OmpH family outer membrane protein [Flavobacteriaceae bacterium]
MKKILFIAITFLVIVSCEQQKIGFVDNVDLINGYQEKIDTEEQLKSKIESFQKRTDSLRQAFQLEINDAEIKARKMSQSAIQKLSKDLQDKEQVLSQRVQFEQNQIAQESRSKNDSIVEKVKNFVKDYGEKNAYSYILGSNEAGSVMYGEETSDLTQTILDALNAEYKKENE